MTEKNNTISVIKGAAILLVVYGHVIQHTMVPLGQDFFSNPVFKFIYTFHMPLFFVISGYLIALSLGRNSIPSAFKSRCKSLLIPFLAWGILGVVTHYFLNIIDGRDVGILNFPQDLLAQLVLNPSVWFLFTLFVLSVLLLLSVVFEGFVGLAAFGLVYAVIMLVSYNNYCSLFFIKWFYLFYLAGYFVGRYKFTLDPKRTQLLVIIAVGLFAFLFPFWSTYDFIYVNKMNFLSNHYFYEVLRIIYRYVLGFLGIGLVFYLCAYLAKTKLSTVLERVGNYALDIYLIQIFIVEGIYPRWIERSHVDINGNSALFLVFIAPLLTIFFVGMCVVASKALIRRNRLLNTLLLGNRS